VPTTDIAPTEDSLYNFTAAINAVLRYAPLARRRQQTAKQHHAQAPVFGWDVVGATVEQLPPRPDRVRGEDPRYLTQLSTVFLPVRVAYSHPETNSSIY
jgi:hypothetical protein